ncbi:MAG: hypothetical protein QM817_09905 [Archangium sp.]
MVLAQCGPPWRSLGTSLEEVRVEGDRVVLCANNGGAYPPPEHIEHACLSFDRKGIATPAMPSAPRPPRAFVEVFPDGGVSGCTTPTACTVLALGKPVPPTTLWDVNDDGTRVALALEDEARVAVFDLSSGARLQTIDPTAKGLTCVLGVHFVGPLIHAEAMECDGAKQKGWLFSGTSPRVEAPSWNSDPTLHSLSLDAQTRLVVTGNPSMVFKVELATGKAKKLTAVPPLDACTPMSCRAGKAPLFGIIPTGTISTDVTPAALTGDGGVVLVSASGFAVIDLTTGKSRVVDFPKCR